MNRPSIRLLLLILIPIAFASNACHQSEDAAEGIDNAAEAIDRALAPREVRLVKPEVREAQPTIRLVGEIRAMDIIPISSEVAGKVDRVLVEVGDRVAAGAPLAEIDRATFAIYLAQAKADVQAARANLDLAAKDLERKRDLRSDETIPKATYDQSIANHDLAKARLAAAKASLDLAVRNHERSVIRAPAAGVITERMVVAGQWADVGAALLELAIGDRVKIAARVPEAWVGRFTDLTSFTFTVGPNPTVHTAKIYSLQPAVREASRSFEIVGTAPNDGSMRPGMFCDVLLTTPESERTLWLPASAVATSDLPQVLMVENDKIVYRKVQIGRRDDDAIEIVGGLDKDEQVIENVAGLTRGLSVKIVD